MLVFVGLSLEHFKVIVMRTAEQVMVAVISAGVAQGLPTASDKKETKD